MPISLQMIAGTDARQLQQLRGSVCAAGHHDLAAGARGQASFGGVKLDAHGTIVFEQHFGRMGACTNLQVRPARAPVRGRLWPCSNAAAGLSSFGSIRSGFRLDPSSSRATSDSRVI